MSTVDALVCFVVLLMGEREPDVLALDDAYADEHWQRSDRADDFTPVDEYDARHALYPRRVDSMVGHAVPCDAAIRAAQAEVDAGRLTTLEGALLADCLHAEIVTDDFTPTSPSSNNNGPTFVRRAA